LQSSWYETSPIPISTQPNFINGVISIRTHLESLQLLKLLLKIESEMGRKRDVKNAARVIDLDLIAYNDEIIATKNLILPHPRLTQRAFVIEPIAEIAPDWKHPVLGLRIEKLKSTVAHQKIIRLSY
jgi:2-amino-4-hydroxy-6-hydroxymethyldihydropteridine diphosphokinase